MIGLRLLCLKTTVSFLKMRREREYLLGDFGRKEMNQGNQKPKHQQYVLLNFWYKYQQMDLAYLNRVEKEK